MRGMIRKLALALMTAGVMLSCTVLGGTKEAAFAGETESLRQETAGNDEDNAKKERDR